MVEQNENERETRAFNLLLNSFLEEHKKLKQNYNPQNTDSNYVDLSEEEIRKIVVELWNNRYLDDLTIFGNEISKFIHEKSNKL